MQVEEKLSFSAEWLNCENTFFGKPVVRGFHLERKDLHGFANTQIMGVGVGTSLLQLTIDQFRF